MKKIKRFNYCENCDKAWEDESPPTKEAYKSNLIKLENNSSVLLNTTGSTHSKNLDGIYCNIDCLAELVKKILNPNKE